jgi:transcriptional regulator with XRE-family HTH domain
VKSKPNKKLLKALGKRVRDLREEQGISQAQLGYESGVHRDQIGRIELGKQAASITVLSGIATTFGIKLKELLDFEY